MARRRPQRRAAHTRQNIGAPISVHIESLSHDGRGFTRVDGKAVFVWGALPGETVTVQRLKGSKDFDLAEVLEITDRSAERVEPKCAVFGTCGGCSLQHLAAEKQIGYKQQVLANNLSRIGKLATTKAPQTWLEPLVAEPWYYRRRARFAVKDTSKKGGSGNGASAKDGVLLGFREREGQAITAMSRCEVLQAPLPALIEPLKTAIGQLSISRDVTQVEVSIGEAIDGAEQPTVAMVFRVMKPTSDSDDALLKAFGAEFGIDIYLQPQGPNSIYPLTAARRLYFPIKLQNQPRLELDFQPTDFIQVNSALNNKMLERAVDLLNPQPGEKILDLFCGLGNFTLPLTQRCEKVVGIEGDFSLVSRARDNAKNNGIDNAEFLVENLFEVNRGAAWLNHRYDAVVLDPPRAGAKEILPFLPKMAASRVLYISCHPGTLARDAGTLVNELGYELTAAGVMDMFPHTSHVESFALFEKK